MIDPELWPAVEWCLWWWGGGLLVAIALWLATPAPDREVGWGLSLLAFAAILPVPYVGLIAIPLLLIVLAAGAVSGETWGPYR